MRSIALDIADTSHARGADARNVLGARGAVADCAGVRVAYDDDAGPDPAIVCLHAVGHGASDFIGVREALHGSHRVVALDWPGHGRSGDDRESPSALRYGAVLAAFIDRLGLDRLVLLGNSIGGAAAIHYAATHPGRVRALILENPGGLLAVDATARIAINAMVRFFAAGARGARWYGPAFAAYYRLVLRQRPAAAQRQRIVAAGYAMAPLLRDAWRSFAAPDGDLRPRIDHVTCPALFAWATQDQFVQLRRSRAAIEQFPNARLEKFRAGHAAHLETPEPFLKTLKEFLRSLA